MTLKKFGESFYYVLDALIEKVEIDKDWFSDNEEQAERINNKINFLKQTKEYAQKRFIAYKRSFTSI